MKNLVQKVIVLLLASSLCMFSSVPANAQGGSAGTIAGVSASTAAVIGGIIFAGWIISDALDDDDTPPFGQPTVPSTTTTTTTTTQGSGSTTTTTTTN